MASDNGTNAALGLLTGLLLGGVIGAGMGVLLAPDSGKETRRKIKETGDKALDDSMRKADEFKTGTIDPLVEKVNTGVKNSVQSVTHRSAPTAKSTK